MVILNIMSPTKRKAPATRTCNSL